MSKVKAHQVVPPSNTNRPATNAAFLRTST